MDILNIIYYVCVGIFMFTALFQLLEQTCCISCLQMDRSVIPGNRKIDSDEGGQDYELERLV